MADRKRKRKGEEEAVVPTKEEYAVAKFLRFNVPVREGKLVGMPVKCFIASKAVDALLESKWSASKAKKDPLFTTRKSCEGYCHNLLLKGLFHRAEKVERKKDRDKSKKKKKDIEEESVDESKKSKKGKKDTDTEKDKIEEVDKKDDDKKEEKKEEKKDEEKKKKEKKVKLNMHDDQKFVDADDQFYVWIYDPVPFKTFLIGLLMVFGAIALCMFPLWPEFVRVGVYYISLAAAGFVGLILGLAVVRLILFCIIWCVTFGKHHFWFLPNLTEDVGIIESFQPLYKHDVVVKDKKDDTKSRTKKDKTSKSSNNEDQTAEEGSDKSEQDEFEIVEKTDLDDEMQLDETDEPIGEDELTDEQIDETDEQNDSEQVEEDSETKKDK